jgi:hypothetical protein
MLGEETAFLIYFYAACLVGTKNKIQLLPHILISLSVSREIYGCREFLRGCFVEGFLVRVVYKHSHFMMMCVRFVLGYLCLQGDIC